MSGIPEYILSDALLGVDIATAYAPFWERLQRDPALRREYEEALGLETAARDGNLATPPRPYDTNLGFLRGEQ